MNLPLKPRREERLRLGIPLDAFVVCILGTVEPGRRIPSLLRAVAALPAEVRRAVRVVVAGEISTTYRAELGVLVRQLGLEASVWWTGKVRFEEFAAYARAADVCAHLRFPVRGDSSLILPQVLAAGTPCIVSDQGPPAEIPDEVAWKVRTPDAELGELTAALERLYRDPRARKDLAESARRYGADFLDARQAAGHYAALIDLTIARREGRSAQWSDRAAEALRACTDPAAAAALIEPWAALRERGQHALRAKHRETPAGDLAPTHPRAA
jgi:glycosyltransferase involved in cell wall biosynthesis